MKFGKTGLPWNFTGQTHHQQCSGRKRELKKLHLVKLFFSYKSWGQIFLIVCKPQRMEHIMLSLEKEITRNCSPGMNQIKEFREKQKQKTKPKKKQRNG